MANEIKVVDEVEYLTTPELVTDYLSTSTVVPERFRHPVSVKQLSGGMGNFTFRLKLDDGTTAVLKHTAPFAAGWREMSLDIARWNAELSSMYTNDGVLESVRTEYVRIPRLYFADKGIRRVLIIEDAGETVVTLKALLGREKKVPYAAVEKLGAEMGLFLAKLHTSTSSNGVTKEVYTKVYELESTRKLCGSRTFGRTQSEVEKWKDPEYTYPPSHGTREQLSELAEKMQDDIMKDNQCLTMGDFWTGNVLVRLTPDDKDLEAAYIVDWELAHPGDPATDMGQMTAEMYCSHAFATPDNAVAAEKLARSFHESYCEHAGVKEGEGYRGKVMMYSGAHVATWMPNVGWGGDDKKKVREVSEKAMEMLWDGYKGGINSGERFFGGLKL